MRVLLVEVRLPIFSIKHVESYQVAVTYPMVPPSTILGAFAYAMFAAGYCNGREACMAEARRLIAKARDTATEGARGEVMLKRDRYLESRFHRKDKSLEEEEEGSRFDAMVRGFIYSGSRLFLIIPRDEGDLEKLSKIAWLIQRIGDTESLATVVGVEKVQAEKCDNKDVNVVVRRDVATGGEYTLTIAHDEEGNRTELAMPVVEKGGVLRPGRVRVDAETLCAQRVVFPSGWEW